MTVLIFLAWWTGGAIVAAAAYGTYRWLCDGCRHVNRGFNDHWGPAE